MRVQVERAEAALLGENRLDRVERSGVLAVSRLVGLHDQTRADEVDRGKEERGERVGEDGEEEERDRARRVDQWEGEQGAAGQEEREAREE